MNPGGGPRLPEECTALRLALVGLPGCGKSTIGRQLARRLALEFVDSDSEIEKRLGMSIRQYFETQGETAFRDVEQQVLQQLCSNRASFVLATGGGIVLREANRRLLRDRMRVVYLHASVNDLWRRLRNDVKRPLLQGDDALERLKSLAREREPLYREVAEFVVETGRQPPSASVNNIAMQVEVLGLAGSVSSYRV